MNQREKFSFHNQHQLYKTYEEVHYLLNKKKFQKKLIQKFTKVLLFQLLEMLQQVNLKHNQFHLEMMLLVDYN